MNTAPTRTTPRTDPHTTPTPRNRRGKLPEVTDPDAIDRPYERTTRHTRQRRWLWIAACTKAAGEGRKIGEVIEAALEEYVGAKGP